MSSGSPVQEWKIMEIRTLGEFTLRDATPIQTKKDETQKESGIRGCAQA